MHLTGGEPCIVYPLNDPHQRRPIQILLAEDNPGAARLTIEALRDAQISNQVHVVHDGEEAMAFVLRQPPFIDAPRPDLILLDLGLPKRDGREVLAKLKQDESLALIPVVVLTTSSDPDDIKDAYRHHVSCYITKPLGIDDYFTAIRSLKELWFNAVQFPEEPSQQT